MDTTTETITVIEQTRTEIAFAVSLPGQSTVVWSAAWQGTEWAIFDPRENLRIVAPSFVGRDDIKRLSILTLGSARSYRAERAA